METVNSVVKQLRALGFAQLAIAKKAKVSQMTISRWEVKSPRLVNLAALKRLSKLLADTKAK